MTPKNLTIFNMLEWAEASFVRIGTKIQAWQDLAFDLAGKLRVVIRLRNIHILNDLRPFMKEHTLLRILCSCICHWYSMPDRNNFIERFDYFLVSSQINVVILWMSKKRIRMISGNFPGIFLKPHKASFQSNWHTARARTHTHTHTHTHTYM